MFEAFGATLAGCLALIGATGSAVYFFMTRKSVGEPVSFEHLQTILTEEIWNVRELVTIRKKITAEIPLADDRKIPLLNVHMPGSDRKLLLSYSGMIVCGCKLDKIRLAREGNRVKIFVPPSRILDLYADVRSIKIHCQDAGIFAKDIKLAEQNALICADLKTQGQIAIQQGVLSEADASVRQMLNDIIERRGLNQSFDVEIVFLNRDRVLALPAPQDFLR